MKRLIYHGQRVGFAGNITHLFKDKRGKEYRFRGVKNVFIGDVYEMNDDETMNVRPKSVDAKGWSLTDAEQTEYEAHKEIVKHQRLLNQKAMQLKKPHIDIVRAINLLKPFFRQLDRINQDRFVSYLKNELSRKAKK